MDMSLVTAFLGTQQAQTQYAVAAEMMKMNTQADAALAEVIAAAQQNIQQMAALAAGIGGSLDISV